jgi:hypothetical protein
MDEETMNNDDPIKPESNSHSEEGGLDEATSSEKEEEEKPGDWDRGRSWDDEEDDGALHWKPSTESIAAKDSSHREIKVAVDWVELEGALENNSPELHSFLNTVTGDVIRIFEGGDNSDLKLKQYETSPDFLYIEPVSSREQYRWMEEFIEIVEESTLKDKLNIAIDGKGAFRRFKDVLVGYPTERERWFVKRSTKLRGHMTEWLVSKHVITTNTPPWEGEGQDDGRRPRGDFEQRGWREGAGDLRSAAHEMIDLIPSRELPMAVSFLEFLRNRRGYKRNRFG